MRTVGLALVLLAGLMSGLIGAASPVAAQTAPRPGCVAGETPGERIDNIVAILIAQAKTEVDARTTTAGDGTARLALECVGMSVLSFYTWSGPALSYDAYLNGESIADQMGDRATAVSALAESFRTALDRVVAEGLLTERLANWVAGRVITTWEWLADYSPSTGDEADIARTMMERGAKLPSVSACLVGDAEHQADGIIAVLIGLELDPGEWDEAIAGSPGCMAAVTMANSFQSPLPSLLGMTAADIWLAYQRGASIAEIAGESGIAIDQLGPLMTDVWERAFRDAAEGDAIAVDPADPSGSTFLASPCGIMCLLDHRVGEPLRPDDPFGILGDEQETE